MAAAKLPSVRALQWKEGRAAQCIGHAEWIVYMVSGPMDTYTKTARAMNRSRSLGAAAIDQDTTAEAKLRQKILLADKTQPSRMLLRRTVVCEGEVLQCICSQVLLHAGCSSDCMQDAGSVAGVLGSGAWTRALLAPVNCCPCELELPSTWWKCIAHVCQPLCSESVLECYVALRNSACVPSLEEVASQP